jgi:hypothetical protein
MLKAELSVKNFKLRREMGGSLPPSLKTPSIAAQLTFIKDSGILSRGKETRSTLAICSTKYRSATGSSEAMTNVLGGSKLKGF